MLDLKAKLLQAGLVTKEQVEKVESEEAAARARKAQKRHGGKKGKGGGPAPVSDEARWQKRVAELKDAPKSEQYETIRGWVQRTRLDQVKGLPSDDADRFHFTKHDGHISWLTLEPDVKQAVSEGKAGIIAFMSHNGLAHCVVPREVALDVGQIRPEWVRHLDGFEVQTKAPRREGEGEGEGEAEAAAEGASSEGVSDATNASAPADGSDGTDGTGGTGGTGNAPA